MPLAFIPAGEAVEVRTEQVRLGTRVRLVPGKLRSPVVKENGTRMADHLMERDDRIGDAIGRSSFT